MKIIPRFLKTHSAYKYSNNRKYYNFKINIFKINIFKINIFKITPVPGGIGLVTTSCMVLNLFNSFKLSNIK